ncbi:MAG: hypothetical protein N2Z80_00290 [Hydrogenothermaceae bacterium]|nr:hypothetical protein [Hydrogenothermaceae bacterium]
MKELIEDKQKYNKMTKAVNPYGDGKASEKIVRLLKENIENVEKV